MQSGMQCRFADGGGLTESLEGIPIPLTTYGVDMTWMTRSELVKICNGALRPIEVRTGAAKTWVLQAEQLPDLIQAVGHLKFVNDGPTMLRGQTSLYDGNPRASLMRAPGGANSRRHALDNFVRTSNGWTCKHVGHSIVDCTERTANGGTGLLKGGCPRFAAEPLLQHYGLRTRWIDVVDNIWGALWFACHDMHVPKTHGSFEFMHVVRRSVDDRGRRYAYVIVVSLSGARTAISSGFDKYAGSGRIVDLRMAVPSFYLRPHAQHGLLVRPWKDDANRLRLTAFQIPLARALDWLGTSVLLSPFGLYPPATVDQGYALLIKKSRSLFIPPVLGSITLIGPGY